MVPFSGSIDSTIARESTSYPSSRSWSPPPWKPFSTAMPMPSTVAPASWHSSISLLTLAVGKEIVDQQHVVAFIEIAFGHDDRELLLLGEGIHGGRVLVAVKIMDCAFLANTTGTLPK